MVSNDEQDRTLDRLMQTRERLAVRWEGQTMLACDGYETFTIQPSGFVCDSQGRSV